MKLSIENYIKIIKSWLYKGTNGLTDTQLGYMEGWFHKTDKEAFEAAISIMHKYEKIQKIVMDGDDTHYNLLMQIKEVLEDAKN